MLVKTFVKQQLCHIVLSSAGQSYLLQSWCYTTGAQHVLATFCTGVRLCLATRRTCVWAAAPVVRVTSTHRDHTCSRFIWPCPRRLNHPRARLTRLSVQLTMSRPTHASASSSKCCRLTPTYISTNQSHVCSHKLSNGHMWATPRCVEPPLSCWMDHPSSEQNRWYPSRFILLSTCCFCQRTGLSLPWSAILFMQGNYLW